MIKTTVLSLRGRTMSPRQDKPASECRGRTFCPASSIQMSCLDLMFYLDRSNRTFRCPASIVWGRTFCPACENFSDKTKTIYFILSGINMKWISLDCMVVKMNLKCKWYLSSIKQWMKDKPEFIGSSIRLQIALEMPYSLWDNLSNIQDNIL